MKVKKRWMAFLDSHTRDAHADLDGQIAEVDEPFDSLLGPIMYPGDPDAEPANVYNCRCTLVYEYPEYPSSIDRVDESGENVGDMSYAEWREMKAGNGATLSAANDTKYDNIPGTPTFVRELLDSEERAVVLSQYEDSIRDQSVENAVIITREGKIYKATGSLNNVSIEGLGDALKGADVTHNHPVGSNNEYSFSNDDISAFHRYGLNSLRGTDERYTYELTRNADEVDDLPVDWANEYNFRHAMVVRDAKEYGFGYRRWRNDKGRS